MLEDYSIIFFMIILYILSKFGAIIYVLSLIFICLIELIYNKEKKYKIAKVDVFLKKY